MFKKVIISLVASSLLATPAMAQRWQGFDESATAGSQAQRRDAPATGASATATGFREPAYTPEQVERAEAASQAAFRRCQDDNLRGQTREVFVEAGTQIGTIIVDRVVNGRRTFGGGYFPRSNYGRGGNSNSRSCEDAANRAYYRTLTATPAYCDRVMVSRRRRDGTLIDGGEVEERCRSRREESFDAQMRY